MCLEYDPEDLACDLPEDDLDTERRDMATLAREARHRVMDYYGTAMHSGMWAAGGDLVAAQQMSDERIIEEAHKLGLL